MSKILHNIKYDGITTSSLLFVIILAGMVIISGCSPSSESNSTPIDPAEINRQNKIKSEYCSEVASLAGQYHWEQNINFSEIIGGIISEIKSFQVPETSLIEFAETVRKHYKRPYDNFVALRIPVAIEENNARMKWSEFNDANRELSHDLQFNTREYRNDPFKKGFMEEVLRRNKQSEEDYHKVYIQKKIERERAEGLSVDAKRKLDVAEIVIARIKYKEQNDISNPDELMAKIKNDYLEFALSLGYGSVAQNTVEYWEPHEMYRKDIKTIFDFVELLKKISIDLNARMNVEELEKLEANLKNNPITAQMMPGEGGVKERIEAEKRLFDAIACLQKTGIELPVPKQLTIPADTDQLEAAIKIIPIDGVLTIQPGSYTISAPLFVDRNIQIVGATGDPNDVTIECNGVFCIYLLAQNANLKDITLKGAIGVSGGISTIENCVIDTTDNSDRKGCVVGIGETSNPVFKSCTFRGAEWGVGIEQKGKGRFEKCEFYGNINCGVVVKNQGDPYILDCTFHDNGVGIFVTQNGWGIFENCIISNNSSHGIIVQSDGDPMIRNCTIKNNGGTGIVINEGGSGNFDGNKMVDNAQGAWAISADAKNVLYVDNVPEKPTHNIQ